MLNLIENYNIAGTL